MEMHEYANCPRLPCPSQLPSATAVAHILELKRLPCLALPFSRCTKLFHEPCWHPPWYM